MTTVCDDRRALHDNGGALSFTEPAGILFTQEEREMLKHQMDGAAVAITTANVVGLVPWPTLAGIATLAYTIIRIYETKTYQSLLGWVRRKLKV